MTRKRLLFVCSRGPECAASIEALEAALMGVMLDQGVGIAIVGEALSHFDPALGLTPFKEKLMQVAEMGLEKVYLVWEDQALDPKEFELREIDGEYLNHADFAALIEQHDQLISF